ncbi:MAG: hypothetical protein RBR67_08975 [Desulfobacterium sp.]|nr:hypothetical protein [Desulfobacterium sp.]
MKVEAVVIHGQNLHPVKTRPLSIETAFWRPHIIPRPAPPLLSR